MDEGEVTLFLEALAEYHAASYDFVNKFPGGIDGIVKEHPTLKGIKEFDGTMDKMMRDNIAQMFDIVAMIGKDYIDPALEEKVLKYKPHSAQIWMEGMFRRSGNFGILIHGDSWAKNAMYL